MVADVIPSYRATTSNCLESVVVPSRARLCSRQHTYLPGSGPEDEVPIMLGGPCISSPRFHHMSLIPLFLVYRDREKERENISVSLSYHMAGTSARRPLVPARPAVGPSGIHQRFRTNLMRSTSLLVQAEILPPILPPEHVRNLQCYRICGSKSYRRALRWRNARDG